MYFSEPLPRDMSIDLRCGYIGVAQHCLYSPQVRAVVQEVSGKGVAQGVRRNIGPDPGFERIQFDPFPEHLSCDAPSLRAYEKNIGFTSAQYFRAGC